MTSSDDAYQYSAWKPPAGVKDHREYAIKEDCDFFIPPPAEIGAVISAASDVKIGKPPWSIPMKCLAALGVTLAAALVVYAVFPRRSNLQAPPAMAMVAALLTGAVAFFLAFKPKQLSYVGRDGAVIYSTRGPRKDATPQMIRYSDIVTVDPKTWLRQKKSTNSTYAYDYRFADGTGQDQLRLKGEYIETFKGRFPRHQYDFVVAAEAAWKRFKGVV